jgi:integrase
LKKIAELAKLKINLSIEVARNTFSSFLKHKVSDYLIDEMLGHSHKSVRDRNYTNIRNLETYLEIMEVLNGKGKEINS